MSRSNLNEITLVDLPKGGAPLWALIYPNVYKVGMTNLGYHYVYAALKTRGVGAERLFFDSNCRSLEEDRHLGEFPIITASVSYEPDYVNLINILADGKISLNWRDRARFNGPVIGIGGAVSYINPLLFSSLADFVCLGDGEVVIDHLVDSLRDYMIHQDRARLWEELSTSPYIYVPPLHDELILSDKDGINRKRGRIQDLSKSLGHSLWLTPEAAFGRTLLLELQRGCFRNCPYCVVPNNFGKARTRSVDDLISFLDNFKGLGDFNVGLVTPEAGDHPHLGQLLDAIMEAEKRVSFASLRIDALNEKVLEALAMGGKRSITIAPEAGSDALRMTIKKHFTNELILKKLAMAKEYGINYVKMYFMIGLPGESDEDIRAIAEMSQSIWDLLKIKLTLSIGIFVPKPGTPFSGEPFIGISEGRRRLNILHRSLRGFGKVITLRPVDFKGSLKEYVLSWYGLKEAESILNLAKNDDRGFLNLPVFRELTQEQLSRLYL